MNKVHLKIICQVNLLSLKYICLDGRLEEVLMDKITLRIEQLCDGLNMDFIDPVKKHFLFLLENRFFFISFQPKVIIAHQLIEYA